MAFEKQELLSGRLLDIWAHVTSVQNYIGSLLSLLWDRFDLLLKLMTCYGWWVSEPPFLGLTY